MTPGYMLLLHKWDFSILKLFNYVTNTYIKQFKNEDEVGDDHLTWEVRGLGFLIDKNKYFDRGSQQKLIESFADAFIGTWKNKCFMEMSTCIMKWP